MSYSVVNDGVQAMCESIAGVSTVLDYEPSSVQDLPAIYHFLDSFRPVGELSVYVYRKVIRLLIRWQDNERAEQELVPFVDSIPAKVVDTKFLGDRIRIDVSTEAPAIAGFVRIGGTMYRSLDVYVDITDKSEWQ